MRSLLIAAALLFSSVLPAQAASYTYVDQQPPYVNPSVPWLVALNTPRIGTTFQVQIPQSSCFGFGNGPSFNSEFVLLTSFHNLNLDAGPWGIRGFLFTLPEFAIWSTYGPGLHTVSISVPPSSALIGVSFYQQVLGLWVSCNTPCPCFGTSSPVSLSRGGHGVIGN